jgi:putative ABC transport system permease protein
MMHIPLREGRLLADTDGGDQPRVAVIGESFRRRYFAGENPIGKFVRLGPEGDSKSPWTQIVGIVGDIKYQPYEREDKPLLYLPYRQAPQNFANLAIRTDGDPSSYAAAIRSRVTAVDPDQPLFEVLPLDKVIANRILGISYVAALLTVMGFMALVLASIGVYGVMAYAVTERTHEIGVRMALGAQPGDVLHLVLRRGVVLTSIGLLIGLPVSFALAQTMSNLIFGVSSADVATFSGGTLLMCAVTLLACYVPARRAMHVDPIVALRHE